MKITQLEAIPINVPLRPGLTTKTAYGLHVDSPYVIVRVHTDEGLIGLGEATLAPRWSGESSASCLAALHDLIGPALVGQDPTQITHCRTLISRTMKQNPFTKAAVEMALWDLVGKATNRPVSACLGGAVYDTIPIKLVVGAFPVPDAVKLAEKFLADGARCLKVKVGLDPQQDFERVRALRELVGSDFPLGIDANGGWPLHVARDMLRRLARFDLRFAEQPINEFNPELLAALHRDSPIPLMADESIFSLADAWYLARLGAVDLFSLYPGKHGGIAATLEIAHIAQAAGIACCIGSNLELGIGTAAMLHVAAASPAFAHAACPADLIGPLYHEADLITTPLSLGPPAASLPTGPGLGVELDESQLAHYRTDK